MPKSKAALVRRLVTLFAARKSIETTFRNFAVGLEKAGQTAGGIAFRKMIESDVVEKIMAESSKILVKHFTVSELEALCKFHESPVGIKFRVLSPEIHQEMTQIAEKYIEKELAKELRSGNNED